VSVTILGLGLVAPAAGDAFRVPRLAPPEDARARRLPRLETLAFTAAREALVPDVDLEKLALVFGTGYGGLTATRDFLEGVATRGAEFGSPIAFQQSVHHSPAGQISILLGSRGPALTMSARELSGESALQVGLTLLASGRAADVLVVAADELSPALEAGHRAFDSLAAAEETSPKTAVRLGEGAAAVLLSKRPGPLRLEHCTLVAHDCPVLRFPSQSQFRPLLLEGARALDGQSAVSLAAANGVILEAETSILGEVVPAPVRWMDATTFGFHASSGLLRVVAAARRLQAATVAASCAVHGLALGGGQALTLLRNVRS
jgi:hypothetical protein